MYSLSDCSSSPIIKTAIYVYIIQYTRHILCLIIINGTSVLFYTLVTTVIFGSLTLHRGEWQPFSVVLLGRIILAPLTVGTVHFANMFPAAIKEIQSWTVCYTYFSTWHCFLFVTWKVYLDPGSLDQGFFFFNLPN